LQRVTNLGHNLRNDRELQRSALGCYPRQISSGQLLEDEESAKILRNARVHHFHDMGVFYPRGRDRLAKHARVCLNRIGRKHRSADKLDANFGFETLMEAKPNVAHAATRQGSHEANIGRDEHALFRLSDDEIPGARLLIATERCTFGKRARRR
jgi:hypothetical protein